MPLASPTDIIRVSPDSSVKKVAGAIAWCLDEGAGEATVQAVGAGAVNQAVKAVAIARGMVATRGRDLWCRIGFATIPHEQEDGKEISVIVLNLDSH